MLARGGGRCSSATGFVRHASRHRLQWQSDCMSRQSATSCLQDCNHHPDVASSASRSSSAALMWPRSSRWPSAGTPTCCLTEHAACSSVLIFTCARKFPHAWLADGQATHGLTAAVALHLAGDAKDKVVELVARTLSRNDQRMVSSVAHSAPSLEHGVQSMHQTG